MWFPIVRKWKVLLIDLSVFIILGLILLRIKQLNRARELEITETLNQKIAYYAHIRWNNRELAQVLQRYDRTKDLEDLISFLQDKFSVPDLAKNEPTLAYEQLRRRIAAKIGKMNDIIQSEMASCSADDESLRIPLERLTAQARERSRELQNKVERIKELDHYNEWRETASVDLRNLVRRRLEDLQQPADCSSAKLLSCVLNEKFGFAFQLQHIVKCFGMAYAGGRTLVLSSASWGEVFKPITNCSLADVEDVVDWLSTVDGKVLVVRMNQKPNAKAPAAPMIVPAEESSVLSKLHGDPSAWWMGQLLQFLWKPQTSFRFKNMREDSSKKADFQTPIVGVYIQRIDNMGSSESIGEYMKQVDEYFKRVELRSAIGKRRIFIVSEEQKVTEEVKLKYKQYEIISPEDVVDGFNTSPFDLLLETVQQIQQLSLCDYLVCTKSSPVCQLAYALMQSRHIDASDKLKSRSNIHSVRRPDAHIRKEARASKFQG